MTADLEDRIDDVRHRRENEARMAASTLLLGDVDTARIHADEYGRLSGEYAALLDEWTEAQS